MPRATTGLAFLNGEKQRIISSDSGVNPNSEMENIVNIKQADLKVKTLESACLEEIVYIHVFIEIIIIILVFFISVFFRVWIV